MWKDKKMHFSFAFRTTDVCILLMVRTYTWNPSTQSSLKIIGNFNNEEEKIGTNLFPTAPTNLLYSTQCFSNSPIYKLNYKNSEVTNTFATVSNDGTQNDATTTSSTVSSAENSHIQCPMHLLYSQTTSLRQPDHQPYPFCYPISHDFPSNSCHCRSHLFPCQVTAPVMPEQTANLKPIDLWYLRPVQIGNKIYYEPVNSSSELHSSPGSIVSHTVTPVNLISIPNNAQPQNASLFHHCNNT